MAENTLQELQVELRRTLTTKALLDVLDTKLIKDSDNPLSSELIIFILGKVQAKMATTKSPLEWNKFRQIALATCQRVDSLDLFMAIKFLLTRQSQSGQLGTQAYEMVQSERAKELLVDILRPCFFDFDEWPVEIIEGAIAQSIDPSETLEQIFRLRTLILNYLERCPLQLVDHIYFGQVIRSFCASIESLHASTLQSLIRCTITNNLLPIFIKSQFSGESDATALVSGIRDKCTVQDQVLIALTIVKSTTDVADDKVNELCAGILIGQKPISGVMQSQWLTKVDKGLIQLKHCSKRIADRLLSLFTSTSLFSGKRLKLACMIAEFWASPNLNRIASPRQLIYVTYLLWHTLKECGPAAFTDPDQSQLFEHIQSGIQERIQKVSGSQQGDQYDHGLLIWKLYIEAMSLEKEFADEAGDDESVDFSKITPEIVFKDFTDVVPVAVKQPVSDDKKSKPIEISPPLDGDSDDEDDDGDFKVKYKAVQDNYSDLVKLQDKPLFISDLIQGLRSDDHQRFKTALYHAEGLIRGQNSNDLDLQCNELLQTLFRTQNQFDQGDFLEMKYRAVQALLETVPKEAIGHVATRIQDSEASVGDKVFLFEAIGSAASSLANSKTDDLRQEESKQSVLDQIKQDNEFFMREPETPMVLAGRITKRLKPTVVKKGSRNMFHQVAGNFFYSCLYLLEDYRGVARFATLLAKGLFTVAMILDSAQNHWEIAKMSRDAFALFQRAKYLSMRVAKSSDQQLLTEDLSLPSLTEDMDAYTKQFEASAEMSNEDARSLWEAITMNLAFLLSKIKFENSHQMAEAAEWLEEQIQAAGGRQELLHVCTFVLKMLTQ